MAIPGSLALAELLASLTLSVAIPSLGTFPLSGLSLHPKRNQDEVPLERQGILSKQPLCI